MSVPRSLALTQANASSLRDGSSLRLITMDETPGTRAVVSFLAPHGRGAWHWFASQAVLDVLQIVVSLATPALAAVAVDQAVEGRLGWGFWGLAAAMAVGALIGAASPLASVRFGVVIGRRLVQRSIAKALDMGLPGRRPFNDGELLYRAGSLAPGLPTYPTVMLRVGTGLAVVLGSLAALVVIDWRFVVVWLACVGLLTLLAQRLIAVLSASQSDYDTLNGRMVNAYADALGGRRTIRASGTLDREVERVTESLPALVATARTLMRSLARGAVTIASADHAVLVATVAAGVWLLATGDLTAGALLAAVRYAQLAYSNVASVFDNGWFHIAMIRAQAAKVMELLASPPAVAPTQEAGHSSESATRGASDVTFREVSVRGDEEYIVRDVHLHIPSGATVAIVGESGVGKTTLGALVGRLLDPDIGEVCINDASVAAWPSDELARTVAYAFETPTLLGDTVGDAIALGREVDDEQVRAAAQSVEADAFIQRLPLGYQTPLHDAPLSGGELQRLGLARAALGDAPILVLDDALSSLDVATAARVFAALRAVGTGRTTIVIAHRASTAAAADAVAWLVDGRLRQFAPHAELWKDPAYRAAFAAAGSEVSAAGEADR